MSVVACRIDGDKCHLAADSITVRGETQTKDNSAKLFKIDDMIVGAIGYSRETSLFRLYAARNKMIEVNEYSLLEYFSNFADWKRAKIGNVEIENEYIIAVDGVAYSIGDWHIERITKYCAIGAGFNFALAAMYLGESAERAVVTAIELSIYCEPPIIELTSEPKYAKLSVK